MSVNPRSQDESREVALRVALGRQIRQLRTQNGLTLDELAARSTCSVGLLSQIEQGKSNPSFLTLVKIAHALGFPIARLVNVESSASPVVESGMGRTLNTPPNTGDGDISYELLTPDLDRALEVVRVRMSPGASTEDTPWVHDGEEAGFMLAGTLEVYLDGTVYTIHKGDTISYPSTIPHSYRNAGLDEVEAIWIITPPTF